MILLITGWFPVYDKIGKTGEKVFGVDYGINLDTGATVVLPEMHPRELGATFNDQIQEWVLYDT
jgi:hypothetical protein